MRERRQGAIDAVSGWTLSKKDEAISGLVPGNPKMKMTRPTAERFLSQFNNLHLMIEEKNGKVSSFLVENLTSPQEKILSILKVSDNTYSFATHSSKNDLALRK